MKKVTTPKNTTPILLVNEDVSLEEQIARRAFELWHHGDRRPGTDMTDWLQAEREVNEWHRQRQNKN
ncbi:MAG: DUF2934 domain-containing protein [Limisphaerales bacterium]